MTDITDELFAFHLGLVVRDLDETTARYGRLLGIPRWYPRETDVLELLLEGLATVEIGRKLFLTPPTVRSHVAALLRKFGVRDREALRARFAEADPLRQADRL